MKSKCEWVRLGKYIQRSTVNNHDLKYGIELIEGVTSQGVFDSPKGSTQWVLPSFR